MNRLSLPSFATAALCALAFALPLQASAADAPAKKAKTAAKAPAALPELSPEQQANAARVLAGKIECEFNQSVDVSELSTQKGYFSVEFKGKKYTMAPEATTTGAVRLEDKKAGTVWLQIANKSMLMDAKKGQRVVDNCVHPNQKI
jgi:hypothetical protein